MEGKPQGGEGPRVRSRIHCKVLGSLGCFEPQDMDVFFGSKPGHNEGQGAGRV